MKYILILGTFLFATTASGCSFVGDADIFKSPQENYGKYDYVLSVSIANGGGEYNPEGSTYILSIHKEHKGTVGGHEIEVVSPGHSCGFFGSVGQNFLWFTNDITSIDESTPKKFFDSVSEVVSLGDSLVEQRPPVQIGCTKEYQPVCAERQVQCVTVPCPPIYETFANTCLAEREAAQIVFEGECGDLEGASQIVIEPSDQEKPAEAPRDQTGPAESPGEDFVKPTTNPPYSNNPDANDDVIPELSWWSRASAWITSLFSW